MGNLTKNAFEASSNKVISPVVSWFAVKKTHLFSITSAINRSAIAVAFKPAYHNKNPSEFHIIPHVLALNPRV